MQSNSSAPSRLIFNFLARCNMTCRFCYCPFDGRQSSLAVWKRIIDRAADWGVRSITFGGGDPWLYKKDFATLLDYTKARFTSPSVFVQVDTNGLGLRREYYPVVKRAVNLLGLPLEGTEEVHNAMRRHPRHFSGVVKLVDAISADASRIKINTVVGKPNVGCLTQLAAIVDRLPVEIWSLYEFWPLGRDGLQFESEFGLAHDVYLAGARLAAASCTRVKVEYGTIMDRRRAYFFVSQAGRAYTVDMSDARNYVELGSIFEDKVLDRWSEHADVEQCWARADRRVDGGTTVKNSELNS